MRCGHGRDLPAKGSGPSCMSVLRGWTWQSTQGGSSAPGPPP